MNTWQPIETAPKDGTEIDLWVVFDKDSLRGYRQPSVKWQERGCSTTDGWRSYGWDWVARDEIQGYPVRWMPVPEPPR